MEINLRFTEEVRGKYAGRKAFGGWYMTHEIHEHDEGVTRLIERLARHVKGLKDGPVLMSPYVRGRKQFDDNPITPEEHERHGMPSWPCFPGLWISWPSRTGR